MVSQHYGRQLGSGIYQSEGGRGFSGGYLRIGARPDGPTVGTRACHELSQGVNGWGLMDWRYIFDLVHPFGEKPAQDC